MRKFLITALFILYFGVTWSAGQSAGLNPAGKPARKRKAASTSAQLRQLQEQLAQLQAQLQQQGQQVEQQEQQIQQQRQQIQQQQSHIQTQDSTITELQQRNTDLQHEARESVHSLEQRLVAATKEGASASSASASETATSVVATQGNSLVEKNAKAEKPSPLSFKIGGAEFTPGGFADLSSVFRSTNVGSGIATGFGAIPYSNTAQGRISEFRMSGQNSRLSLRVDSQLGANKVLGYVEADFWGTQPTSGYVTSNGNTLRMRMYLVDVTRGKWEVLAGQPWSLLTPNRRGISPLPSDLFISLNADSNYQAGLVWARQAAFRVAYHPSNTWALGLSLENPEQFVGGSVTLPSTLNSVLSSQLDNGTNTATPNSHPDVIAKVAHDQDLGGKRNWHFEVAGLLTSIKTVTPDSATAPTQWFSRSATGGGISVNNFIDVSKTFRLLATTFWSDGGGRYILGLGPDAIVRATTQGTHTIGQPGLVHSGSAIGGFEWVASKSLTLAGYYSGAYFQRYAFADPTKPGSYAGFGYVGSSLASNRAIQEATLDVIRTLWKDPNYGSLLWEMQTSYITRSPWYVPAGSPRNAHVFQGFMELRYTLP